MPNIGQLQMRTSYEFCLAPGIPTDKQIQYPDANSLAKMNLMEIQPLRIGFYADSMIAKFGSFFEFKTGYHKDNFKNSYNAYLNQLIPEQRIKSINLKVMDYLMPNK